MDSEKSFEKQSGSADKNKLFVQMIWGAVLVLAGIGVFFRIPQVMPQIERMEQFSSAIFFVRFCFYFLGILLVGGGSKKIYDNYRKLNDSDSSP
jgi:hypothetical protein